MGDATRSTPKPLMQIDEDVTFLDALLDNLTRQGFDDILLLAGHMGDQIADRYPDGRYREARVRVHIEGQPCGTGGALREAHDLLDERFLLLNGDSYFDINFRELVEKAFTSGAPALVALRTIEDAGRYGSVELQGDRIVRFLEKDPTASGPSLINAGVYVLARETIAAISRLPCSIETDVFPKMVADGQLHGTLCEGYFIDIGIPESLEAARVDLPILHRRPTAFLDRDGVINVDGGYSHRPEQLRFVKGAEAAILTLNNLGYRVIVVSNQAGVAHGIYDEAAVHAFHAAISEQLAKNGAYIDRFYYCPYHPDGRIPEYRAAHPERKPEPGMLLKAFADQPIDIERSFLIGDMETDIEAAKRAGIPGFLFTGGDLSAFVRRVIKIVPARRTPESPS